MQLVDVREAIEDAAKLLFDVSEPFEPSWYFDAPRRIAANSIALISKPAADRWVWRLIRSPSRAGCQPS